MLILILEVPYPCFKKVLSPFITKFATCTNFLDFRALCAGWSAPSALLGGKGKAITPSLLKVDKPKYSRTKTLQKVKIMFNTLGF